MYEFHYDYTKPKYGEHLKLCYLDTDSLGYHIKTKDFWADIASDGYDMADARPLPI